jgi:hypothetical protein
MRDHLVQRCRGANTGAERTDSPFHPSKQYSARNPAPDGPKDDFNYDANWMKHGNGADEVEIEELMVTLWLYRAISKYHAVYGIGTPEMAALFPWAGEAGVAVGNASPEEPPHAA